MSELRWTLLILGVVFIAALSWWERRRPRQAFAPRLRDASVSHGELSHGDAHQRSTADPAVAGEPWIGEAGLAEVLSSDMTLSGAAPPAAGPGPGIGPLDQLPTVMIPDAEDQLALKTAWDERPPEPTLIDPEAGAIVPGAELLEAVQPSTTPEPEIVGAEGVGAVRIIEPFAGSEAPPEPTVEWPPEESRRILSLRLIAPPAERFPGRALRLAMAAEGFVLGKFAIFHKPDEANCAVLSAASLTRPGAFDLETMDSQRYGGLSLFAVLPGPKAPPQAFEELLATARNLNERLQGALQDERGGPLTALRVASIRDGLRAEAATLQATAAHEA
ncbi:MAG: cell division protein ZipA C-terminal FtsZ-binding domain-containing protein [Steroidobacteraceae bacterium]